MAHDRFRYMAAFMAAVLSGGCAVFAKRPDPEQVATLPAEVRRDLQPLEAATQDAATEWEFRRRQLAIAEAAEDAVRARRRAAPAIAAWARERATEAGLRFASDQRTALIYCQQRFTALADVHEAEADWRAGAVRARRAEVRAAHAAWRWREATLSRARLSAVMQQPGYLREDHDKAVGRWDRVVAKRKKARDRTAVAARTAAQHEQDLRKAWLGHAARFQDQYPDPCAMDWELPDLQSTRVHTVIESRPEPVAAPLSVGTPDGAPADADASAATAETPARIELPRTSPPPAPLQPFPKPQSDTTRRDDSPFTGNGE
ncbi:MAG: hypothetical protein D6761_12165 [Candidatus Dadabacteria bacterium]|nr:MAG: hypothetical protein D6761_12165 [Candidatus Dadabacteria bacterium]